MDKTVKLRAFAEPEKRDVPQAKPADDRSVSLELAKRTAQLEEERSKSLELLKTIVQLRESLKQERAKTAELEKKAKEIAVLGARVRDLSAALGQISSIAAAGKTNSEP